MNSQSSQDELGAEQAQTILRDVTPAWTFGRSDATLYLASAVIKSIEAAKCDVPPVKMVIMGIPSDRYDLDINISWIHPNVT